MKRKSNMPSATMILSNIINKIEGVIEEKEKERLLKVAIPISYFEEFYRLWCAANTSSKLLVEVDNGEGTCYFNSESDFAHALMVLKYLTE